MRLGLKDVANVGVLLPKGGRREASVGRTCSGLRPVLPTVEAEVSGLILVPKERRCLKGRRFFASPGVTKASRLVILRQTYFRRLFRRRLRLRLYPCM